MTKACLILISIFCSINLINGQNWTQDQQEFPTFSCMEKHAHLFNSSLVENIACGEAVDIKNIRWCLRLALADHLEKELQYGLNTKLVPGLISEKDRMKIVLARCLYRRRPLHIIENISEFMDSKEIEIFIYHLIKHMGERTLIISDDNVRLARGTSSAIVVKDRKLIEKGSFEELLNSRGVFCKMYNNLK